MWLCVVASVAVAWEVAAGVRTPRNAHRVRALVNMRECCECVVSCARAVVALFHAIVNGTPRGVGIHSAAVFMGGVRQPQLPATTLAA